MLQSGQNGKSCKYNKGHNNLKYLQYPLHYNERAKNQTILNNLWPFNLMGWLNVDKKKIMKKKIYQIHKEFEGKCRKKFLYVIRVSIKHTARDIYTTRKDEKTREKKVIQIKG